MTHGLNDDDDDDEREDFGFENEDGHVDAALVLPQPLKRLLPRQGSSYADFAAATAALMLTFARSTSLDCSRRTCRAKGICQKPPLSCAVRRHADIYNWDQGFENGPRAAMYEALDQKPADTASVVRQHTPDLAPDMLGIPQRKKSR